MCVVKPTNNQALLTRALSVLKTLERLKLTAQQQKWGKMGKRTGVPQRTSETPNSQPNSPTTVTIDSSIFCLLYSCVKKIRSVLYFTSTRNPTQHRAMYPCGGNRFSHTETGGEKRCSTKKELASQAVLWKIKSRYTHIKTKTSLNQRLVVVVYRRFLAPTII
jgi:hypothetical protein